MVKTVKLLTVLLLLLATKEVISAEKENLVSPTIKILAEDDYYPYSRKSETGGAEGITVDIIKAAFEEMGVTAIFSPENFDRAMRKVKDGHEICCFNTPFEKRIANDYLWPEHELYISETFFYAREDFKGKISKIKDLEGKKLGLTLGYGYGDEINGNIKINKSWVKSDEINMKKLIAGRIDIVAQNPYIAMRLISKLGAKGKIKPAGKIPTQRHMHLVFSKHHDKSEKWLELFDKGMEKIIENRQYESIFSDWEKKLNATTRVK